MNKITPMIVSIKKSQSKKSRIKQAWIPNYLLMVNRVNPMCKLKEQDCGETQSPLHLLQGQEEDVYNPIYLASPANNKHIFCERGHKDSIVSTPPSPL